MKNVNNRGFVVRKALWLCLMTIGFAASSQAQYRGNVVVHGRAVLCDFPGDDFKCQNPHGFRNPMIFYKRVGAHNWNHITAGIFGRFQLGLARGEYLLYVRGRDAHTGLCTDTIPAYCPGDSLVALNNEHGKYSTAFSKFKILISPTTRNIDIEYYERQPV